MFSDEERDLSENASSDECVGYVCCLKHQHSETRLPHLILTTDNSNFQEGISAANWFQIH